MVVDRELLLRPVVGEAERPERGIRREVAHALEAEAAVEERAVVRDRHRVHRRNPRHVHVDAARRDRHPVGLRQGVDDLLDLPRRVRIEERERGARVPSDVAARLGHRETVVPGLVAERAARRHVRVDPPRRGDARVRPAVDRREGDGPEEGAGEDGVGDRARQRNESRAGEPRPERDAGQRRERGIGRVQVPDGLDQREAVVQEQEEDVRRQGRERPRAAAHDRDDAPRERGDRGEAERKAGAPQHEVLDGEEERAPGPLEGGREARHRAGQPGELLQVVEPPRVEAEGERAGAEEDVGEEDAHRHGRGDEDQDPRQDHPADRRRAAARFRVAASRGGERAHEERDSHREEQRERRDLAGGGEPDGETGRGLAAGAGAPLGDADGPEQRRRGERRQERVDGPEVGELNSRARRTRTAPRRTARRAGARSGARSDRRARP